MRDGFAGYDSWKLASPDDEAEDRERQRLRDEHLADMADELNDRERDARCEREILRERYPREADCGE